MFNNYNMLSKSTLNTNKTSLWNRIVVRPCASGVRLSLNGIAGHLRDLSMRPHNAVKQVHRGSGRIYLFNRNDNAFWAPTTLFGILLYMLLTSVAYAQPTATAVGFIEVIDGKERFMNVKTTKPLPVVIQGEGINLGDVSIGDIVLDTNSQHYNNLLAKNILNDISNLIKPSDTVAQHHTNILLTELNRTISAMGGGSVDLSNYVTTAHLDAALGSYVLSSSLNNYITATSLNNTLSSYVLQSALSNYLTSSDLTTTLNNYNPKIPNGNAGQVWKMLNDNTQGWGTDVVGSGGGGSVDLSDYVTTTDLSSTLGSYVLSSSLNNYITATSLNNTLSSYVTNASLNSTLDNYSQTSHTHDNYLTSDDLSNYATLVDLEDYVTTENLNTALEDYATTADLEELDSRLVNYSLVGHNHSDYVTTEELDTTLQDYATVESVSTNYALKGHPHEITDIVGLSELLSTVNSSAPDTTAINNNNNLLAYNNQLLEEYLGYGTGYEYKCDSIFVTATRFLNDVERDTTKRMIIDYISIQTDSANIGYEITVRKLTSPATTKIVFKNERLTGNVTVNFNLVGTPLVLQPDEHLFIQKTLTNGGAKAKAWLSIKYRQR